MDWFVVTGVPPYDGRYPFDGNRELNARELGWIKRLAGYLPLNVEEGFRGGDAELVVVLTAIALCRTGRIDTRQVPEVFEVLLDAPYGSGITIESDSVQAEDDAGPPPSSSSSNGATSGADSPTSSESQEPTRSNTGTPASATSESASTKSAT